MEQQLLKEPLAAVHAPHHLQQPLPADLLRPIRAADAFVVWRTGESSCAHGERLRKQQPAGPRAFERRVKGSHGKRMLAQCSVAPALVVGSARA